MKRFLLLSALSSKILLALPSTAFALFLPSIENPAVWGEAPLVNRNGCDTVKNTELQSSLSIRYSSPFPSFHNAKIDGSWKKEKHIISAGFGSATLDSIYRELEFSGDYEIKANNFLTFKLRETANLEWIPQYDSWWEHNIKIGGVYSNEWAFAGISANAKFAKKENTQFSGALSLGVNFPLYSFGGEVPIYKGSGGQANWRMGTFGVLLFQKVSLGYFELSNSFTIPNFALGFGAQFNIARLAFAISHHRNSHPNGHTGYTVSF